MGSNSVLHETAGTRDRQREKIGLLSDIRLLVILFVCARALLGLAHQPALLEYYDAGGQPRIVQRGMTTFGDFRYYYALAQLSDEGYWPYRDYWYEFPPVWPAIFIGLYRMVGPAYAPWATLLGAMLLACEVGNLLLLRELACRLHGAAVATALAWVYAVGIAPLVFTWWNFEALVVLLILLALWALLTGRERLSAAGTAAGILTKFVPALLLPTVWRFWGRAAALRYTALSLGGAGAVAMMMIGWGGKTAVASLTAQAVRPSYQTVWAVLDGNWRTGAMAPPDQHFDRGAIRGEGAAPVLPGGLRALPFLVVGLSVYRRTTCRDSAGIVAFFTLTVVLFVLWAQGWSPQWVVVLAPLILLNYPTRTGVLVCLVLGAGALVEYPALFARTAATAGMIAGRWTAPYVMLILARTLVLLGLAGALIVRLTGERTNVYE